MDVRARKDAMRNEAVAQIREDVHRVCAERHVVCTIDQKVRGRRLGFHTLVRVPYGIWYMVYGIWYMVYGIGQCVTRRCVCGITRVYSRLACECISCMW